MSENNNHQESTKPAVFTDTEARVIACLMEKQLTTPNNYPLSMNSLLLACNQKSNRVPVMNLTEGEVGHAVGQLENRKLVGVDYGGRATHVTHRVITVFDIDRKQQAVLAVLMVREPVTLNDIKTKTARMEDFAGIDEVLSVVNSLVDRDQALVIKLPKGLGSREDRYTHLLCGDVDVTEVMQQVKVSSSGKASRMDELEARVSQLEEQMQELMNNQA